MIVDLFAGPGGWDVALAAMGHRSIGLEWDRAACATRAAVGHATIRTDVGTYPTGPFGHVDGVIASPPCPAFSTAGKGHGADLVPLIVDAIHRRDWAARPHPDPEVWLVIDLGRWLTDLSPTWIACEQVPAVLPIWRAYTHVLDALGYSTWCGTLNAADYGVPQTRERAILLAHRDRRVGHPPPTHTDNDALALFDTLAPWVSVEDALGWSGEIGFPRLADDGEATEDGYRSRDWRSTARPALTMTEKARSWTIRRRQMSAQAGGRKIEYTRPAARPAPTVATQSARQWIITADDDNTITRKLTLPEALTLQSFPVDYPVAGARSVQFAQIGNAIPPRLATHILTQVLPVASIT